MGPALAKEAREAQIDNLDLRFVRRGLVGRVQPDDVGVAGRAQHLEFTDQVFDVDIGHH